MSAKSGQSRRVKTHSVKVMPKIRDLIKYGYFPEELPPVFTTVDFSEVDSFSALAKPSKKTSESLSFSIPRKGMNRRRLAIPNPAHYLDLCLMIVKRYPELKKFIESNNSSTRPVFNLNGESGTRAILSKDNYIEFILKCFNLSHGMSFGLSADISRFYSTIYTHIIPWIIHGRDFAKTQRSGNLLGNELDIKLRNLQGGQTFGILTGPDIFH